MQPTKSPTTKPKYISLGTSSADSSICHRTRRPHGRTGTPSPLSFCSMLLQPHGHGGWRPHSRGRMQHALSHPAPRRTTGTSPARRSTGLGAWPVRISATSSTSSATQPRLPRPRPYRLADLRTSPTNPVVQTYEYDDTSLP